MEPIKPKVTIVVIAPVDANYKIEMEAYRSNFSQDYKNYDVLFHFEKPIKYEESYMRNLYKNCSKNNEIARKLAIAGDADYFLFKDWDIVLPKNAISSFMKQTGERVTGVPYFDPKTGEKIPPGQPVPEIHIQCGWFPLYYQGTKWFLKWPAGIFVADNTFAHYKQIAPSLVRSDIACAGCCFMSRKAATELYFEHGCDINLQDDNLQPMFGGEALALGNLAYEKGFNIFMNGDVVCKHTKRGYGKWITSCLLILRRKIALLKQKVMTRVEGLITWVDLSQKPSKNL